MVVLFLILLQFLYLWITAVAQSSMSFSLFFVFHSEETILFAFFTLTFVFPIFYKENMIINCLIQAHSPCTDYLIVSTSASFSQFDLQFYFENNYFLPDLPPQLFSRVSCLGFLIFWSAHCLLCWYFSYIISYHLDVEDVLNNLCLIWFFLMVGPIQLLCINTLSPISNNDIFLYFDVFTSSSLLYLCKWSFVVAFLPLHH